MNKLIRYEIFSRLKTAIPNPATELTFGTPFELLVAVILSAQSTDKGVNKATARLFPMANTAAAMLKLGENGLSEYIKTIGLYNNKARNILKTCALLVERYEGQVPRERSALESLPGVGRKTANVILATAFGEITIAVDTHVFRVSNRTGIARGTTVSEVERKLMKAVPQEFMRDAHHLLILHGRYTCIARKPLCPTCVINELCEYKHKTLPAGQDGGKILDLARLES
ncbi:MAG: endonuclease III [Gammaproteobacteria bacterium]